MAAILALGGYLQGSVWLAVLASLSFVLMAVRSGGGFNTLVVLFAGFHALYGLSGPLATLYGGELHPLFTRPYETGAFLFNYSLATIGLTVGVLVTQRSRRIDFAPTQTHRTPRQLAGYAILLGISSSAMEMVNLVRVGGVAVLLEGKSAYQSLAADLVLDLPSNAFAIVATGVMALALDASRREREERVSRSQVAAFSLSLLPLVAVAVLLGQRGLLLGWLLIALVGAGYGRSLRRLNLSFVALAFAVYFALGLIYASRGSRGIALSIGDWSAALKSSVGRDAMIRAFNPAANEFGVTLGNFGEYLKTNDHQLGLGETYLVGLLQPLPSFLYPGTKPQQATFRFRDLAFPGEAERGSIASTGYSSILEAHYNFRETGVLVVYFLLGVALTTLERMRARSRSLGFGLVYLMLVPSTVMFHRSSFSDSVITPGVVYFIVLCACWAAASFLEEVSLAWSRLTRVPSAPNSVRPAPASNG